MSVLKLSKNDIIRNDDKEEKIKLKRSDLSYDTAMVSGWEQSNKQSLDIINNYNNRISNNEWLSKEDRANYRSALDSYIETTNLLRGINKTFGDGYSWEDERNWSSSISSMNKGYDDINGFYDKFASDKEYDSWHKTKIADENYQKFFEVVDATTASQGWQKYLDDEQAKLDAIKAEKEEKSFWDKFVDVILEANQMSAQTGDTTLPMGTYTATVNALREDESYLRPSDDWTQEQKNAFGQLYASNPILAYKFAEETNKRNNNKKEEDALKAIAQSATANGWAGAGHTLGAIATAPLGLADYLNDLAYMSAGRDIAPDGSVSPFEYSQAVTGGISEHLNEYGVLNENIPIIGGKGWGDVYGLGTSIAQSAASGLTLGGAGTFISYFGQAAASGIDEALSRGASEGQAVLYGTALGVFEGVAEKIGIDNLFKLSSSSTVKGLIKNILKQAGAEGLEEGLTAVLGNIADVFIMQDKSNFAYQLAAYQNEGLSESDAKWKVFRDSLEGIAYDAIAGAVSGGVHGGAVSGVKTVFTNANATKNFSGQAMDLVNEAVSSENAEVKAVGEKYQKKLNDNKKLSGWNLSELLEVTDSQKVKSAVEAQLTKLGETSDVSRLSEVITKQIQGVELSKKEQALIDNSKFGQRIVNTSDRDNIKSGKYDTRWAKGIGTRRLNADVYNKSPYDILADAMDEERKARINAVTKNTTSKEIATESDFEVSEDGKTRIGDTEVTIKEIASIKDGVVTLRLEDGSTVNASDVEYSSSEEGLLYENVVHMGLNATTANAFINGYEGNMPVAEYALDFRQAYRYGELGIPKSEMNSERFASRLSASVKDLAYNLGTIDAKYKASEKQSQKAKIESTVTINAEKNASKGKKKGRLYNTLKPTTELQRTSLKTLSVLAEALNMDIYTFESAKNSKGQHIGANGWYDLKDNSLHLDLYAGKDGRGTMLFTAAHELTHHIREKLPVKFKAFADFLFEQYGEKGVPVSELIARKIDHLEKNGRTKGLTESQIYDLAYEEVVADACESFLADGDAVAKIAELKTKDKTLWQTIKDFLAKLVARIKAAYEGLSPDSVEGRLVAEMLDSAEKLKAMWTEMLVEASEIVEIDVESESVSPMFSERTWTESEYVAERDETAKKISEALGVNLKTAYKYIDDINGVARLIADDRARLDYEPNLDEKATVLKPNSEYKFSVDMSTLCAKRLLFTGTFDAIQKALPNMVFESEDIVSLREMMQKRGYEVACGICYVESTRREIGRITQEFIDRYKVAQQTGKPISRINSSGKEVILKSAGRTFSADKNYTPNLGELNTTDIDIVKRDHREVYDAYLAFMNARGQAKPKLLETRAEYKGEILKHFKAKSSVEARNNAGGLRLQSFSDFEVPHMIDMMQIVMDMSRVGLKSQAYTKVPAFAEIFGGSGVKINLSLIAKGDGLDANGNLIFDDVEGINHQEAFKLRDQYSKNVGTILVGKTDAHIIAAMADSRIDYIIPFHKSSWKESLYDALGLTGYADYTDFQNEKPIDKDRKIKNFDPSEYWDFTKTGDENAQIYLEKCREDGRIPKFPQFQGYPGYWKLLIDFKMYDNDGIGSPQEVVKPIFNTEASERILSEYKGGHKSFPVAKDVVEDFVKERKDKVKYSDRDSSYLDAVNRGDMETAQRMVDEAAKEAGYTVKAYHGTNQFGFTKFDASKSDDKSTFFFSNDLAHASTYAGKDIFRTKNIKDAKSFKYEKGKKYTKEELKEAYDVIQSRWHTYGEIKINEEKQYVSHAGSRYSAKQVMEMANRISKEGIYGVYLNTDNLLEIDAEGKGWGNIKAPDDFFEFVNETSWGGQTPYVTTRDYAKYAKAKGYDGLIISNLKDWGNRNPPVTFRYEREGSGAKTDYILFDSERVKSADSVTYDDNGNIIPLSERFNPKNSDIRYSDRYQSADTNSDILTMVKKVADGNFRANEKVDLGTVSDSTATEIHKITGIDVKGFKVAIEARQIEHILKDHGKNGIADSSMANPSDIAKIEYTIDNYDDIRPAGKTQAYTHMVNGKNKTADTVLYEKEIGEKSYYVVQAVPDTKAKTLYIVTAFIGKKGYKKEASQLINAKSLDVTAKTGSVNTSNGSIPQSPNSVKREFSDAEEKLSSYRDPDSVSNRSLLANALESVVQNDIERNKLKEYKSKIALIESEQAKLHDLREQIKELSFAKGKRDTEAIKQLQFEANQTANRINTYDRQLLNLESTKALKGVLEREKQMAYKKAMKEGKEALARQKEKAANTQRELLTRYQESRKKGIEGRHKTEMRYKIKSVVNELNQYLTKGTKEKHVPIELQKAVAEALNAVNMDTVGAEERIAKKRAEMMVAKSPEVVERLAKEIGHIEEMGGNMAKKIARLKTAYDSIINSDDPLIANSHDDVITNTIDRVLEVVGETPLRDMSLYQLEAVYDMYRMVLTTIRNTNKAFKAAKGEEISTIANGVIDELMDKKRKSPYSTKGKQAISEFDWNNYKPIYAFERIGSANFTKVFNAVRAGEDVWANDMSEAQAFRKEQFKKYKRDSWDFKKRYGFTSTSGMRFELTLDQMLSLYAFSKREQAGDHLKNGGFVFDGLTEVKVKNKVGVTVTYQLKDATAYNLSEETLGEIIDKLTPEQKAFADAMQDYLSTVMGEKGNEVSLALYDIKLFKEKHYFPLKSAPQYMAKAKEQAQGEVKIKNSGFTKETTPKAKNPIVLSSFMDVWAGHVNEMSMYHAFTLPLEDFYRVYNYHTPADAKMEMVSVGASLENAHGQASVKYIDQLLKDLNGGARSDPRETLGKSAMSNFKKASVMASFSVVVQQPTAMVRAMALVDAKYFVGQKVAKGKHKEMWAEVKKYAPVAVIKEMGYFDTGMGKGSVEWLKGEKTFKDKLDDATSKLPALADEATWVAIWNAVKRETVHTHKNLRPNSDEFLKVVGERFAEVIVKTQVYDSTLSRSANMRSKSALMNMWTAFMAEPTTSINMLQDAFRKGNKKYTARAICAVYGSVILNSALVSIIYAMRDDDEDETFMEKYLSRLTAEVIDGINPITYIPFFKDIWSLAQGFDVERADMSLINDVIDSLQQAVKVISKDTSSMDENELAEHRKAVNEAILSITDNLSSLVGVPVKNVRRDINGIINAWMTIGEDIGGRKTTVGSLGDNILEDLKDSVPVWGWFPDESKGDKLYDAIIKEDTAYVDRLKGAYKDDKAFSSAIRKALRENDPRIKEAAVARYNGDGGKYVKIVKGIIGEGNFKQDDVVAAINSEIDSLKKVKGN